MKILIGFTEIAGYYKNLKHGFCELGNECYFVNFNDHVFKYGGDDEISVIPWMKKVITQIRIASSKKQRAKRLFLIAIIKLLKIYFFIWCIYKFDVFIFGFGRSFFGYNFKQFKFIDLPILKFFKKKVLFVFNGSDSRPPYLSGTAMAKSSGVSIEQCIEMTMQKKKEIEVIDRYADYIIDYPAQGLFHSRPFVNGLIIGLPCNIKDTSIRFENSEVRNEHIRIVHAPSHPEAKGTFIIRETINNLKAKGYLIDYIEIQGMPNYVVLEKLASCDIVVDQVYADLSMPGLASEAAWFGKPVIIAGYAQNLVNALPLDAIPPTHYCRPEELEQAIEKLIIDKNYRISLGSKAQRFVKNTWAAKKVAERFINIINDDIPEEWIVDPRKIRSFHGDSFSEDKVKQTICDVVSTGGVEALMLHDKPELEIAILEYVGIKKDIQ